MILLTCGPTDNSNCDPREYTLERDELFRFGDGEGEQNALVLNSELPLNDKVTLYGFVTWSDRDNLAGGFYRQADDDDDGDGDKEGRNVPAVYPDGFLPLIRSKIEDSSIAAGAHTELAGWDMDFSWNWGENVFDFDVENSINASLGATSPRKVDSGGLELNSSSWNLDAVQELQSDWIVAWGMEIRSEEFIIREGEPASYCGPVGRRRKR